MIFIPHDLYKEPENLLLTSLYHTTYRTLWTLSIGWIVLACYFGYGGPINSFLSMTIWQPFVKLSFCAYLLHLQVQSLDIGLYRTPGYFSDLQMVIKLIVKLNFIENIFL